MREFVTPRKGRRRVELWARDKVLIALVKRGHRCKSIGELLGIKGSTVHEKFGIRTGELTRKYISGAKKKGRWVKRSKEDLMKDFKELALLYNYKK